MNSRKVMKILIKVLENRPKKKLPKTESTYETKYSRMHQAKYTAFKKFKFKFVLTNQIISNFLKALFYIFYFVHF